MTMPIANPLFQADNWQTAPAGDPRGPGNQQPTGWTMLVTPQGQPMPWPSKHSAAGNVPALAGGPGEHVHKLASQLPANEQLGQTRALLVLPNTNKIYKCFGNIPQAVALQQAISEPPGTVKKYSLYILAETSNQPTSGGQLENDHWRVALTLGDAGAQSDYAGMKNVRAITGNERAWNRLDVTATFPASGTLTLSITCQQNWPGATDFFIAGVTEELISAPPGDSGNPPSTPSTPTTLQDINAGLTMINNAQTYLEAARLALTVAAQREQMKNG